MLYYSHVNEDSRVERELMQDLVISNIVAVAGSGERVLALMENASIKNIVVVDLNKDALHLLQLKICMLSNLKARDYLKFIGHSNSEKDFRKNWFEKIKARLTVECRDYWEHRIHIIEKGILNAGHFEIFLKKVRPMLTLVLGKDFLKQVCQESWRESTLLAAKWKVVSWLFSWQWVYRFMGNKDLAFISTDAAVEQIPAALTNLINESRASASFIFHLIFKGHLREMKESDLPPSLQEKTLNTIRARLLKGKLVVNYHHTDLLEYVRGADNVRGKTTFYSVSDILSFENQFYLEKLIQSCLKYPGNRIIIRSFLRNRISSEQLHQLSGTYGGVDKLDAKESTGMYQVIAIKS